MNGITWEMLEQALEEKKLEVLEDYKVLDFICKEMHIIAQKYKTNDKKKDVLPEHNYDKGILDRIKDIHSEEDLSKIKANVLKIKHGMVIF